nr:hypothetical protein [uncultured Arsenicibacter sp.]
MTSEPDDITPLSGSDLQPYLHTPALLQALLKQLIKDFSMARVQLPVACEEAYSFERLRQVIADTLRDQAPHSAQLQNVFYRVDLTEKLVRQALHNHQGDTLPVIAELIIKRELQKVVIRHWYQQNDSST